MGGGLHHIFLTPYPEWFLVRLRASLNPWPGPSTLEVHSWCVLYALYRGQCCFQDKEEGKEDLLSVHYKAGVMSDTLATMS